MATGHSHLPAASDYCKALIFSRVSQVQILTQQPKPSLFVSDFEEGCRDMASTSAVSMEMPLTSSTSQKKRSPLTTGTSFFKPLNRNSLKAAASRSSVRFQVKASLKEKFVAGLTAATASSYMVIPEIAEAAGSGVSPSLKNFLLSIAAGGVVVTAIIGAVIGVSNFDPVKRG